MIPNRLTVNRRPLSTALRIHRLVRTMRARIKVMRIPNHTALLRGLNSRRQVVINIRRRTGKDNFHLRNLRHTHRTSHPTLVTGLNRQRATRLVRNRRRTLNHKVFRNSINTNRPTGRNTRNTPTLLGHHDRRRYRQVAAST